MSCSDVFYAGVSKFSSVVQLRSVCDLNKKAPVICLTLLLQLKFA